VSIPWSEEEIILACELVVENGWKELRTDDPRAAHLSALLISFRLHPRALRDSKFRNVNGVRRKTADLATRHPDYAGAVTRGNRLDREIVNAFINDADGMRKTAAEIRATIARDEDLHHSDQFPDLEDMTAVEGRVLLSRHLRRERNASLRSGKIAERRRRDLPIACEVCSFDFEAVYGARGADYIEVHHLLPLHVSGLTQTRLADLGLVCSNCHRMLHRAPWITPATLREQL
jgi:5-methylcytosine-specific restriction protein A